jgi:hypothetical protein
MAFFRADFDREAGNKGEGICVDPPKKVISASDFDPSGPRHQAEVRRAG